jgi:thioredoxin 1
VDESFRVIHVDIGRADKNLDLAEKYGIPLDKGVPAVAVLEFDGKLLHSQRNGEFEPARRLDAPVFVEFLKRWQRK